MSSTHTPGDETPDDDEIFPFIVDADTDRGQHIFCQNLLVNLFEPGISPCKTEFPDVKIKRQIIDHYLKDICNITQQYGIYSIEFTSPNHNNRTYTIQTDDLDLEFSKVFSEYIKSIQYHNSQRANSIFTNEVFAIIYSYISILENEIPLTNVSPTETSKHLKVRHEITLLSSYLNIIKENFTKDDVSQHTKHDLQKILAWFIIDYFTHNIDLIAQARKNFRPQNSNDDTAITEQSDYVWDPEWSHPAFISFPQSISSQAIGTISYIRDYVRVIPLTIDATPLNYNTFLPDTQNNSLNSTVIHNENLNGTRNLTQQDIQTPSHFINEEIVHTTTTQQSISPIRPNLTTPRNTNPSQTQVTLQSTVKPSVAPKYSHMDYQTYRPMTIPSKTRKTFTRNNFADHNYNYTHPSKTNYQPQRNFNQYTKPRNWDNPTAQYNSKNFQPNPPQDRSENYPFFQQNKNKKQTSYQMDYLSSDDDFLQPDIFAPNTQEYRRQGIQKTRANYRNLSPQPIDAQHQQPIQQQNPINTQSFQPIQQQNPMTAHSYQASQMQNEIPLPYYLQQHEITRNQLSNFSQMPNAAESLQMTMNPYLMGGSSITSNKPLMVFTGTDPEYSVEDYLNAVTANLILNIGPEPINTPLHQNWIHRRTALIQTTLDGAAQKWFSVLPLEIKSNWKRFTQEFSKMFDSERNKQQQRVLCNEIRRLPNETIKQIAVRIETLVRKAYSLNTHDYKNTKMTEILMMTLTPQLRKIAIKKRASHPSSIREPDLDFRKLVDKLEQAEITMKLEETENLKLQYVNRIETTPTNINNIQESETDLVEKITEILNIYEKNPNFKGKPSFKKWCNYCQRYGHSISECKQKQQDSQNKPQKYKEPNKSFYQYMKKDQNLPNKTVHSNNSSGKPLPNNTNYTRNQSPYNSSYRGRSPERRNTYNSSQNHYNRPNSRNNYSRSNSNTQRFVSRSNSQSRNNYYPNNQSRNSSYNRNRNYSYNRNRSYSNNRNQNYPNNRSRNNSYNRSNYNRPNNNYQNRSRNNSQNRHPSYNNRYRNYSQSPHRNNNNYNNSNNRHRSSTPKHQRQINQVQANPETTSDPPGIDNTVTDTLQLNQINCTSSDSESDTENTLSINMIKVENDYESVIYEQPFPSHIYENQSEFLQNYYTTPINSTPTTQETNEINTTDQTNKNTKTKCLNTNHIYQNIQKEQPKEKIWTIPFLLESPRNKEFQPPDLEIDFLIDSGAESNIINIPTWNEIKTLHPKLTPLDTSSKLATAQGSTLINYGKIQLFLLPTRTMEQSKILNKPFKQIFHITDIKYNIIGIPFISKYIPTINILNSKILIKDKYTKTKETSLTFFQRLNKQPPFFSKFYPIYNQQRKHLKPLSGNIYNFSIKQVHQYDKEQNKQKFYMSDFEFKPIHKFFKITISSIKYLKNSNSDIISLHVYNNTPYQVTLPLGLLGYCETNATISPIHEKAYRVNNILQLLDICQSTILNEELSINNIISNENRNTDYFTKTPYFKPTFNISNYTEKQQKFLTMFNFQHSQITQDEFEKLAKQLIKYSSVYATSKFDVGKISSSLHLPLKPDAVFKKQRASKVPIHLHDKVNRLLDILEQYNIISPVNKEEQPKGNTFINPVIILAKGESLKIVLDARYLNSLIDESKCNWPIEPIQVILTKINGKYFTNADMNSAYNQMPLDEQSRRLTQFVIGNQQYEFNRLFYGISIGPAAFSAFMSKIFRPLILKKNAITYLDDVFMQSQTKDEMFKVLEKYHQILQNENLKAAPDKSHFFLTRVKFLGHNIERKTITPLKSRIDAIQKLQPPTNKKKIQEFLGMLNFLSKYVYKMQLYLRPFYNILRQQNNFEWNTENQARFEEIKKLLTEQISNTIPDPDQPFYAMCDASNFGIGAALLQSHNGTNKMNLISANSRLFTQAELRLSTLMRECTAIIYTLTEYEFLILGSKHPTVLFTDHKPIIFLFTQKSNPNHRVYRFQLILMKFPNLHIVWTAGKNLALPDTLSRNTPPELLTRKTTVEIPKNIKFYLAENETSPRLECKYAVKTDIEQSQINNLQHFPLYLDCQNNHYEVDLLGTSTFKPIPYSQWIKNNTQQKRTKQHLPKKDHFPLIEKEDLTDKINLSGPQTNDSKYTINQVFDLHDPLDTIPLSKLEIENIFLPPTETITISTLKQYQNLDPVIRQLKSWHKYKTKPIKADSTILGNKTLLRYFRKFNNTTINENTDLLEYNLNESTVPCLPISMILIAFNISHTQNIKGHSGSEKTYSNFIQNFYFPNAPIWIKVLCNDCIVCQLNKPYPNQKQIAQKQDFKGQSLYFNHRISFDTKGPISPSSEGNSYIMVIVDAFTHYVALNPVPHCNAYYAYTTLYEHWIAKFGLPEILVTDNGTEFINNEIITLCHLYNIKHKPRTSHAPWTNGLVEGMNRSLQEYLRCIINGNDTKYTEWSADVKLFPLAYNSQITTTLGMSPYEMVFNQKPRKPIMFTANSHKNAQGYCQPNKDSICYNLPLHTHDEDHFHHPQILKLASGTHTEWILNRDKKHNEIYQKITKKLLQRQNINDQINSRFTPASDLKIGTFVLIPNFNTQKGISKKLQPLRKGPYQIIAKPTDVTYKITDSDKKEIVQHRNNLLPYYPKEYALRELTQLYSFTGLKIIQNEPHLKNTEQNDNPTENQNTKPTATKNNTQNHKEPPKPRKNRKMTEQIIPQEEIDKSEHRKATRLRNQPRKNYKMFIPQSKILKKVEFKK